MHTLGKMVPVHLAEHAFVGVLVTAFFHFLTFGPISRFAHKEKNPRDLLELFGPTDP